MLSVCCMAVLRDFDFELGRQMVNLLKIEQGAASLRQPTWFLCFRGLRMSHLFLCVPFCFWQPCRTWFDAGRSVGSSKMSPWAIVARGGLPTCGSSSQRKKRQHL